METNMPGKLDYTPDQILSEHDYSARIRRRELLFHGGLDEKGNYIPPRSRYRPDAIAAWTAQLASAGHPTHVVTRDECKRAFFPNVEQSKLLLRHGARGAMTRIITLIGVTEGFGNDGIKLMPRIDLQAHFKESIEHTCLAHLHKGLFEAHGNDEAGRGAEAGHDVMWYEIRDAALENPPITPDMYENLPIAPPPGYQGPAKPAAEAITVSQLATQMFPSLDPLVELTLRAMAQILVIELVAFDTFAWAKTVLSDPECCAEPDFAPWLVDCIQQDESIHVAYLQCALSEARCRTLLGRNGEELPGNEVIDAFCESTRQALLGGERWERMIRYRMGQVRDELAGRRDGARLLEEFATLGPTPSETSPLAAAI